MRAKIDDGGKAFPITAPVPHGGMTLRQYYATAAMQGCVSDIRYDFSEDQIQGMASYAFRLADAMIWHEKLEKERRLENMRPDDSPEEKLVEACRVAKRFIETTCSPATDSVSRLALERLESALSRWENEK